MNILLKCPTRSRPERVVATLTQYAKLASDRSRIGLAVSCDTTDADMMNPKNVRELQTVLSRFGWSRIYYSDNTCKIEACNANMGEIDFAWDIVMLISDDMVPQIEGYDGIVRRFMRTSFPDTDGILWFNDGYQADELNTLSILGRKMYERLGNIYEPVYKSLFCDTEFTDRCRGEFKDKVLYSSTVIIRHEHPGAGFGSMDNLYLVNQAYFSRDMMTYISRKTYAYDWSVLIPSLVERDAMLDGLLTSIKEKVARLCPSLRVEFCLDVDNRQKSVGKKRGDLLKQAKGKYLSFIDDDDSITDAYVEDLWACIQGGHQCMRLNGQMGDYVFTHNIGVTLEDKMVVGEPPVFQRPPNHLNPILSDIARFVKFKDATHGEDLDWTVSMIKTGLLRNEYPADVSRIHYHYNITGRSVTKQTIDAQRAMTFEQMLPHLFTPASRLPLPASDPRRPALRLGPRGFVST